MTWDTSNYDGNGLRTPDLCRLSASLSKFLRLSGRSNKNTRSLDIGGCVFRPFSLNSKEIAMLRLRCIAGGAKLRFLFDLIMFFFPRN